MADGRLRLKAQGIRDKYKRSGHLYVYIGMRWSIGFYYLFYLQMGIFMSPTRSF
jgi:hypothetical protein